MTPKTILDLLPRYQRLRIELERLFSTLPVGSKIPTEQEISKEFKISRVTARKALKALRASGTLESFPGRGTFVAKTMHHPVQVPQNRLLGLLVPNAGWPEVAGIVRGAEAEATRLGYHVILAHDHGDPELQMSQFAKMQNANVAGILLYPDRFVTERKKFLTLLQKFKEKNVPLVMLDRYVPGLDFPCVLTDNVQGMYQLTEHVICCGRRRPALIGFWAGNTVHVDRRRGFMQALRDLKIPTDHVLEAQIGADDEFFSAARNTVAKWIKGKTASQLPFDSIICMYDILAYGAFTALREADLKVPDDIALAGYDNFDFPMYRGLGLELTSVQQPLEAEGAKAVAMLIDRIEGKQNNSRASRLLLPPQLIVRTSCGEPARNG